MLRCYALHFAMPIAACLFCRYDASTIVFRAPRLLRNASCRLFTLAVFFCFE